MRKYSVKEALLQKWKKKLLEIEVLEEDSIAQNRLIAIINSTGDPYTRLENFNQEKKKILNSEDWSFFSWLWSLITSLFSFFWSNPTPPSLKEVLEEGITIERFDRLSEIQLENSNEVPLLNDEDYENALFTTPQRALADLQSRINSLERDNINNTLERLDAFKYHLSKDTYQKWLTKLYQQFPLETLAYRYALYSEDPQYNPGSEEFIEHELMGRALMDLFILPLSTEPMNPRCIAVQQLLLLLSLSNEENPPLQAWLDQAITTNTDPSKLYLELSQIYDQAKQTIVNLLPEKIREAGQKKPGYGNFRHPDFDFPIKVLEQVIDNPQSFKEDSYQAPPLSQHLARLACQEFLLNYYQLTDESERKGSILLSTLEFLSDKLLGTWQTVKTEQEYRREGLSSLAVCEQMLNPNQHESLVQLDYQRAAFYANQLVVARFLSEDYLIVKAKQIAKQKLAFEAHELTWILNVVERINSTDLAEEVKEILIGKAPASESSKEQTWVKDTKEPSAQGQFFSNNQINTELPEDRNDHSLCNIS